MEPPSTKEADSTASTNASSSRSQATGTTSTKIQNLLPNRSTPTGFPASLQSFSQSNTSSSLPDSDIPLSIQVYLQNQQRKVRPSQGDGNCLFRSYSFQLFGSEEEHIAIRTAAIRLVNLNQSVFTPYLTSLNKTTMEEHIQHVQRPSVFGTHIEILAIATLLNVPTFYCCQSGRAQQFRWHCVSPLTQEGLRQPDLSGSPLEDILPPTHFELHNIHYDSIVSVSGEPCTDFPILNTEQIYVDLS